MHGTPVALSVNRAVVFKPNCVVYAVGSLTMHGWLLRAGCRMHKIYRMNMMHRVRLSQRRLYDDSTQNLLSACQYSFAMALSAWDLTNVHWLVNRLLKGQGC
jgi:hypothetical protein